MRLGSVIGFSALLLTQVVHAACPGPDCFGGGGPSATDCILTWSGVTTSATTCVDGSACDQDCRRRVHVRSACLGDAAAA